MNTIWIGENVLRVLGEQGHAAMAEAIMHLDSNPPSATSGGVKFEVAGKRFLAGAILENVYALLDVAPTRERPPPREWRSLILPGHVVDEFLDHKDWEALYKRLLDIANIAESRERSGLKYLRQQHVHTIFAPGGYHRLHFTVEGANLSTVLGLFEADLWSTHTNSATIRQPTPQQLSAWNKLHENALESQQGLPRLILPAEQPPVAAPAPLRDGWITLNQLREHGIVHEETMRQVLAMRGEDELLELMGQVSDEQFELIERAFTKWLHAEARRRERKLTTLEVYQLTASSRSAHGARSFEAAMALLTPQQSNVLKLGRDVPIRLQGGPGTGKTFTAVMRAGMLARRAKDQGQPVRIGFFVFNHDLGSKIFEQMLALGLDPFLEESSPQHIVITSLHDWCARFVKVDELKVEPLAPYRAEKGDGHRRAAIELAVDEARKRLRGLEYDSLWALFDIRSKHGLWEIETEISQFIKARDIADLSSYLNEKRPPGWWLANTEKTFKKFVWEIATIYNDTLRNLGFVDSDDLTNDAIKEVTKTVWQQYRKPEQGFDYLILDEAQDFFRNQLTLLRHLVKRPEGFMMCFDEAQAVYSRYPSLKDIGFDTDVRFQGTRLEQNFRSTRQIVAALQQLLSNYPTLGLVDNWGAFTSGSEGTGERPVACGFSTATAMLDQVRDIIRGEFRNGMKASDIGVIGFD
ncbi:MAG TPA: UvrD-helicase domain-containing protein, partial [Archangium sp.]|uniref:UvrD-helicase domain-containing protein n=1 Tax=Archangium sp. TaxID=1872627 RepID=UPI002ED94C15